MNPKARSVQSVENVGRVLELFTPDNPEIGVTQAARHLGMSKSSVHALLTALTRIGLLHRFVTGRYRLGFQIMALNSVLMSHTTWRAVAREEMTHLADIVREPVHLAALDGAQAICVDKVEGNAPLADTQVGSTMPPHATALGKVILAYRSPEDIERWLQGAALRPYTEHTLTSAGELLKDFSRIREQGYALSLEERTAGVCSIAAPIHDANGEVIAAMSISTSPRRFEQRRASLAHHLREATESTSRRSGYDPALVPTDGLYWHSIAGQSQLRRAPSRRKSGGSS